MTEDSTLQEFKTEVCERLERIEHSIDDIGSDLTSIIDAVRLIGQELNINKSINRVADNIAKKAAQRKKTR